MNGRRILTIARKDLSEVLRNKQAIAPLLVVPILFAAVFPAAIALLGRSPVLTASINGLDAFLDNLPAGVLPPDLDTGGIVIYAALTYFMAPMFLMIPIMVASVIGSSSFVGEKERRTLEGLLYTPVTNRELVLGNPVVGRAFFPNVTWLIVVFLLVPVIAFLAITLIVAVSGRSTTVQGAQGISILVLLPALALVIGQATGLMLFDAPVALIAVVVIAAIDVAVFLAVAKTFQRERLVTKLTERGSAGARCHKARPLAPSTPERYNAPAKDHTERSARARPSMESTPVVLRTAQAGQRRPRGSGDRVPQGKRSPDASGRVRSVAGDGVPVPLTRQCSQAP